MTFNLKDFPDSSLAPYSIAAQHPDSFLTGLFRQHPESTSALILAQVAALRRPPLTLALVLDILAHHTPDFVSLVRAKLAEQG